MLPAAYRLTKQHDFKRVAHSGRSFFSHLFRVSTCANTLKRPRVAVVVSTKVSKKAVARNKLKRQVRAVVAAHLEQLATGRDVVIAARSQALAQPFAAVEQDLLSILTKARLLPTLSPR